MITEGKVIKQIKGLLRSAQAPWCVKCRARMRTNGSAYYCVEGCSERPDTNPWCVCCCVEMVAHGYTDNGTPRWQCRSCGQSVVAGYRQRGFEEDVYYCRSVRKQDKYDAAVVLFNKGMSVRKVAEELSIHPKTARKYREMGIKETVYCECGQNAQHQGFCWWRYQNSPKRQEFMKRWHRQSA